MPTKKKKNDKTDTSLLSRAKAYTASMGDAINEAISDARKAIDKKTMAKPDSQGRPVGKGGQARADAIDDEVTYITSGRRKRK